MNHLTNLTKLGLVILMSFGPLVVGCAKSSKSNVANDQEKQVAKNESSPKPKKKPTPSPESIVPKENKEPKQEAGEDSGEKEISSENEPASHTVEDESERKVTRERFLLLAPGGPLVVELAVTIDGQTIDSTLEPIVQMALKAGDTDGDGIATWDEVLDSPRFRYGGFGNTRVSQDSQKRQIKQVFDTNGDSEMNESEVVRFITNDNAAGRAFTVTGSSYYREVNRIRSRIRMLLDTNESGILDPEEVAVADVKMRGYDTDDDGILYASDFVPTSELQNNRAMSRGAGPMPAMMLGRLANWSRILYGLEELYAYGDQLAADSFPLVPKLFKELDGNDDSTIDEEELKKLNSVKPHIVMDVRFGRATENDETDKPLKLVDISEELGKKVDNSSQRRLLIDLPNGHLDVSVGNDVGDSFEQRATGLLTQLDTDKNGYLDKEELPDESSELMAPLEAVDLDGDGKVFKNEIREFLEVRGAASRLQIYVQVSHREDALFAALDSNGDQRIDERELLAASDRIHVLDQNGDGRITSSELPDYLVATIGRGQAPRNNMAVQSQVIYNAKATESAPRWFQRTDANQDGVISRREFLGDQDKFQLLDTNGDQFIDYKEASGFEKTSNSNAPK